MEYSTLEFLKALDESKMTTSAKLIRDSLLNGTFPGKGVLSEATSEIVSISLVQEPNGVGVSVKQADGHEYRYAAADNVEKYNTPEKVLATAQKLLKFRPSGAVLGWLDRNAILYFGSKRGNDKKFPETEAISREVNIELSKLIKEIHPEYSDAEVIDAVDAFILDFNINSDDDYYRIGPNKLKNSL